MARRTLVVGLTVLLAIGAAPAMSATPDPRPPVSPLVSFRPALQRLVDALASFHTIESSHIGVAGAPSAAWAAWDAVREEATPAELAQLTGHGSVVVRGYVLQHVARSAVSIDTRTKVELTGALRDRAAVRMREGCMGGMETIADIVLRELCWNTKDQVGAQAIMREVAADASYGPTRDAAQRCVRR